MEDQVQHSVSFLSQVVVADFDRCCKHSTALLKLSTKCRAQLLAEEGTAPHVENVSAEQA